MAGVIQADYLQPTSSAGLTILTPSGNTIMSMNTAGVFSSGSSLFVAANGQVLGFGTSFPGTVTANTVTANTVQIGQSGSSSNNFTLYQPSTPDGTVRLGNGNAGSVTDLLTLTSAGNLGIGTSPGAKLEVLQTSTSTPSVNLRYNSTSLYGQHLMDPNGIYVIQSPAANGVTAGVLKLATNSGFALLDSSGNLGLGVSPSAWGSYYPAMEGNGASAFSFVAKANQVQIGSNFYQNNSFQNLYTTTGQKAAKYAIDAPSASHQWFVANSSGTAGNAISFTQAMTLDASGNLLLGKTSKNGVVGVNSPFSINLASIGSVAGGGTGAVDTGISINGGAAGGCIIFMASRNVGAGTQTSSAVYIITLYYDGNNAPAVAYVGGSLNFCTFGVSASNTLTVTNAGSGNASYSWIINK